MSTLQRKWALVFFAFLHCMNQGAMGQSAGPITKPENQSILEYHEKMAKDYLSKNLNRFAYERMLKYNDSLDSLYNSEKSDTLANIERVFKEKSSNQMTSIAQLRERISKLRTEQESLESTYSNLLRKALIAFGVWLVIVLVLLRFRRRNLSRARKKLEDSTTRQQTMEELAVKAEQLFSYSSKVIEPLKSAELAGRQMLSTVNEAASHAKVPADWAQAESESTQLYRSLESELNVADAVLSQSLVSEETEEVDINKLCEQYLEMASRGYKDENINIQVTRDFEKRLPAIKLNPIAVGNLLLNILSNAFQSVKAKSTMEIAGYQPKVAMSTRILPRFLQIRIRDNGQGMSSAVLDKAMEEFFTTRDLTEGAGLGLHIANNIVSEVHKGEIKMESDEGNSTDVYIKFFI